MVTIRQRQRQQQLTTKASEIKKASTVALMVVSTSTPLTVTNLTANESKHYTKTEQYHSSSCQQIKPLFVYRLLQLCGNIQFVLMFVLIIAFALIDAGGAAAVTKATAAVPVKLVPSPDNAQGRFFSKSLPIFGGSTQQLFASLLQQNQHQRGRNDRLRRQDHPPPTDGNIFAQLNSFIQARQRNASDITGNILFKYYNT